MTTLHVCFADLPNYGNEAATHSHECNTAMNEIGTYAELDGVIDATATTAALTLRTDLNKDTPPCTPSPGGHSAQSISPNPRYERNMSFFQQLSRRFGLLRTSDDPIISAVDDDSTDSCSSSTTTAKTTAALQSEKRCFLIGASNTSSTLCSENNNRSGRNIHINDSAASAVKDGSHDGSSCERISCASSDELSSTADIDETHSSTTVTTATPISPLTKERRCSAARSSFSRLHRRSTSSIRRAFENFSLSTRSLSCSGSGNTTLPSSTSSSISAQHVCMGVGSSSSSNCNTPIKSALKYHSNIELNRKSLSAGNSATSRQSTSGSNTSSASSVQQSKCSSKSKTKPPPQRILRQPVAYTYLKGISGLPTQRVPRSAVCCQYARR